MGLPRVFFDLSADNQPVGRIIIEVSQDYMEKRVKIKFADKQNVVV